MINGLILQFVLNLIYRKKQINIDIWTLSNVEKINLSNNKSIRKPVLSTLP